MPLCAVACLCTLDKPCAASERGKKINKTNEERLKSSYWLELIANGVTGRNNKQVGKDFIIWISWFYTNQHWVGIVIIREGKGNLENDSVHYSIQYTEWH